MNQDDRIKGSLFGLIWGDALGCPIETWQENDIQKIYGTYSDLPTEYPVEKIAEMDKKRASRLRPIGLHSDDGQQAMALINVCLNNNGWNKIAWANMLKDGKAKDAWRGTGRFFDDAVRKLQKGVYIEQAGSESSGIGSAMRIGPLGAYFRDDVKKLQIAVIESCATTHADLASIAYSYAVAHSVYMLVNDNMVEDVIAELPKAVKEVETMILNDFKAWTAIDRSKKHVVSETIATLFKEGINDLPRVRHRIAELAKPHLAEGFSKAHPNQGFVLTGGMHALIMGLQSVLSPNEALLSIVRMGYDTDTVAAIAGSILGANHGIDWIPVDKFYDKDRVKKYGDALVERKTSPETPIDFVTKESNLTKVEKTYQSKNK